MLIKSPVKFRSEELCDKKHVDLLGMFCLTLFQTSQSILKQNRLLQINWFPLENLALNTPRLRRAQAQGFGLLGKLKAAWTEQRRWGTDGHVDLPRQRKAHFNR